jgi:gliding motility-associated-like protein
MQKEVLMDRLPQISVFPAMDTICRGRDTAMLRAYTIDTLLWMPSTSINCTSCDTTHVFPSVTTTYIAQAKNWIGCTNYDTAIVKVYGPIDLKVFPADTAICPGKTISYRLNVNGITSWLPAIGLSNSNIKNPVATPFQDITYTAIVKDSAGCFTDTAFANVHVFPLPAVNAGPDKLVSYNSSFTITPVYSADVISYTWTPVINLICSNCDAPSGTALQTTTYTVKTTSVNGCTSSDNINIVIACENGNLLLPTAFSPNGNGINEYFYPIARGYKTIKKFVIFNRRGNKVFERQNFVPNIRSMGWDGRINNADNVADSETFAWYIEAECEQGQLVTNKGTVVLIR